MILALDISKTNTGWAYGDGSVTGTISGARAFDQIFDYGHLFNVYKNWLCDLITTHEPDIIAIEGTYPGIKGTAGYLLNTMNGITHMTGYVMDKRRMEFTPTDIKKFLTGNGTAKKAEMVAHITAKGFVIDSDDEADAVAVLLRAYHQLKTEGAN